MRTTQIVRGASLGGTKAFFRTILNPSPHRLDTSRSLEELSPGLSFAPKALVLFSTVQYSRAMVDKLVELREKHDDLQIFYAAVDSMAPFLHRNGLAELWLNKRVSVRKATSMEDISKSQESGNMSKPGRIVSSGSDKNWELNKGNWFLINIPFVPKSLSQHHSAAPPTTDIRFKLGSTIFANPENFLTCFYFVSAKERKTLSRMDMKIFTDVKKYLDNDGHYLHDLEIVLPPFLTPSRQLKFRNYNRMEPISGGALLKVTEVTGNLIKKINSQPAASIIQDNDSLMAQMTKETKLYATIQDDVYAGQFDVRRYEVIAGGGAWGAKASTLALDPDAANFLKEGSIIKFYMVQPGKELVTSINKAKDVLFFPEQKVKGGIFAESSIAEEHYHNTSSLEYVSPFIPNAANETVLDNVFGFGSEQGLQINNINFDSEGEVVAFQDFDASIYGKKNKSSN